MPDLKNAKLAIPLVILAGLLWSFGPLVVRYMTDPHLVPWQYIFGRGLTIFIILNLYLYFEEGMNFYKRVEDAKCQSAKDWWLENSEYWQSVRNVWSDIYLRNEDLKLENKVEGKKLYSVLFSMDIKSSNKKIKKAIMPYVKSKS